MLTASEQRLRRAQNMRRGGVTIVEDRIFTVLRWGIVGMFIFVALFFGIDPLGGDSDEEIRDRGFRGTPPGMISVTAQGLPLGPLT